MSFFAQPLWMLFVILAVYQFSLWLRKTTGSVWLPPILTCTVLLIVYLKLFGVDYQYFQKGAEVVDFWLKPAVVVLAVPLYQQRKNIIQLWLPITVSQVLGSIVGLVSGVWLARLFGAADIVAVSLAAKSVTNPIALDITLSLNGIPAITAVGVIFAGLTGQILGFKLLEVLGIKTMSAQGLALGSASHALGINAAWQRGPEYAAYATLGLILNGILSAIIAPYLIPWLFA